LARKLTFLYALSLSFQGHGFFVANHIEAPYFLSYSKTRFSARWQCEWQWWTSSIYGSTTFLWTSSARPFHPRRL